MNITTIVEGQNLEASESFYLGNGESNFTIFIEDIELAFHFLGDENAPSIDAKIDEEDPKKININLVNWNNPLGTSNRFNEIAFIGDKTIAVSLYVNSIISDGRIGRRVAYTVTSKPGGVK